MQVIELVLDHINERLLQGVNIIYGAGYNGKLLYDKLREKDINIFAFYDDDSSRWGEQYCGREIISRERFSKIDDENTNIVISSMYVGQILEKLQYLQKGQIFTAIEILLQKDTEDFHFSEYQHNKQYIEELNWLENQFDDALSRSYYQILRETVLIGKALPLICDLYCGEPQYFLDTIKEKINSVNVLDAGAYTGDTVRQMFSCGIEPDTIYSFEADKNNYYKLIKTREKFKDKAKWICENKALWNENTILGMKFDNYNARIDVNSSDMSVEAVTIDDYFQDKDIGFIKMDIEGAELNALKGGISIIKRCRPILAISMYHGLEDMVKVPKLLMKELREYKFMIRHHSYTYSETVFYGIPMEL